MKSIRLASGLLVVVVPALLASCGYYDYEEREPWRAEAENACFARNLVTLSAYIKTSGAIEGKGICGLDRPLRVSAVEDGTVSLGERSLVMSCPMTAALEAWVKTAVMPAAYARYGSPVVEIRNFGTYNCRGRNNVPGAPLSEHAFANAFDFTGVKLANGYTVTVKTGWNGSATDRVFLREITAAACGPFTTVLGPGSDAQHEDHLHLDLARHNVRGTYRYCKPHPDVPMPSTAVVAVNTPPPLAGQTAAPVWPGGATPVYAAPAMSTATVGILSQGGDSGFDTPLPPEAVATPADSAAYANQDPTVVVPGRTAARTPSPVTRQPVACPPGYICTPVGANARSTDIAPPVGWNIGPRPLGGYSDGDITSSISGYSDD